MSDYEFDDEDPDIIIRRIKPLPPCMSHDCRWGKADDDAFKVYYVEIFPEECPWPEGIGVVVEYTNLASSDGRMSLQYVFVLDRSRRQGYGTRILRACHKRWPDIGYSGATESGVLLIAKYTGRENDPEMLEEARRCNG